MVDLLIELGEEVVGGLVVGSGERRKAGRGGRKLFKSPAEKNSESESGTCES